MNRKRKIIKIIDVMFIILMVFITVIAIIGMTDERMIIEFEEENVVLEQFVKIFLSFLVAIFAEFWWVVLYLGIRIAVSKFYKHKLDKSDLKKYENYYRDIIEEYSIGVLSYIDDFKIDESTIIATLMSLELKGIIKLNDKVEIVSENIEKLDKNETYIYNCIKNSNLKRISMSEYEKNIIQDCKEKGLLEERKSIKQIIIKGILIIILILILIRIIPMFLSTVLEEEYLLITEIIVFLLSTVSPFAIIVYICTYYFMNKKSPYIRNKKAKQLNENLEGLKNYLKDYSNLEDKSKDELILWENYLIYSVVFKQNKKIIEEYKKKIS